MYRKEAEDKIVSIIESFFQSNDHKYRFLGEYLLEEIEKMGMKPPSLPGYKCQRMLKRYIEPNTFIWEDKFDEDFKEELDGK